MALQKKVYRNSRNRSRGGVKGSIVDSGHGSTGKTKKNYDNQVRSHFGGGTDEAMKALAESIKRRAG